MTLERLSELLDKLNTCDDLDLYWPLWKEVQAQAEKVGMGIIYLPPLNSMALYRKPKTTDRRSVRINGNVKKSTDDLSHDAEAYYNK
jgi:hypothetical protein